MLGGQQQPSFVQPRSFWHSTKAKGLSCGTSNTARCCWCRTSSFFCLGVSAPASHRRDQPNTARLTDGSLAPSRQTRQGPHYPLAWKFAESQQYAMLWIPRNIPRNHLSTYLLHITLSRCEMSNAKSHAKHATKLPLRSHLSSQSPKGWKPELHEILAGDCAETQGKTNHDSRLLHSQEGMTTATSVSQRKHKVVKDLPGNSAGAIGLGCMTSRKSQQPPTRPALFSHIYLCSNCPFAS